MGKVIFKNIDELDDKKWLELLKNSNFTTFFHTKPWFLVWKKSYPQTDFYLFLLEDQKKNYLAGLPFWVKKKFGLKKFFSLPFGTYGGFVFDKKLGEKEVSFFINRCIETLKGWNVLKIEVVDFFKKFDFLESLGFQPREYFTHLLDLNNFFENDSYRGFTKKRREAIRQSEKRGVWIKDVESEAEVEKCYELTLATYSRYKIKKPKYPLLLFRNIFKIMQGQPYLKWAIAKKDEKIIGSLINFAFRDMVCAWEGASDYTYQSLRPNDALCFHSILWAKKNNFKIYNFGATPEKALGMLRFKESWGTKKRYYKIWEWESFCGRVLEKTRKLV